MKPKTLKRKLAGVHMTGKMAEFECPVCGMWQPHIEGVIGCLNKFHRLDAKNTYWDVPPEGGEVVNNSSGRYWFVDLYDLGKETKDSSSKKELATVDDMVKKGFIPEGVAKLIKNRIKERMGK